MNQSNGEQQSLKYLGFFRVALTSTCVYLSTVYEAAKDQAGPLKPGVQDVEDLLKVVIRPLLYLADENFSKLLDFVDKKVCLCAHIVQCVTLSKSTPCFP
jgi:hypothetical protein